MRKIIASTVVLGLAFGVGTSAQAQLLSSLLRSPVPTVGVAVSNVGQAAAQLPALNRGVQPVITQTSPALVPVTNSVFKTLGAITSGVHGAGSAIAKGNISPVVPH